MTDYSNKSDPLSLREAERRRLKENNIRKIAYVIGNGTTRKNFDLNKLTNKGTTFGCNALYRDYEPDYLIGVDNKMITEIVQYAKNHATIQKTKDYLNQSFYARHLPDDIEWHNILPPSRGWASGPTAMLLAIETLLYNEIYLLGMDFIGIRKNNLPNTFNNMYAGSSCYQPINSKETFYINWVRQIDVLLGEFPGVNIYRVQPKDYFIPVEFSEHSNLKHITYQDFEDFLQNTTK